MLLGVFLVLVIGSMANQGNKPAARTAAGSAGTTSTQPAANQATASQAAAAPVAPAGPLTTFGEGLWEIGVDVAEGKYKTTGKDPSGFMGCYAATLKENNGEIGDIGKQNISDGPMTMTLKKSDGYFDTKGCQDWVRQS